MAKKKESTSSKFIQITAVSYRNGATPSSDIEFVIIALDEDGRVWERSDGSSAWIRLTDNRYTHEEKDE